MTGLAEVYIRSCYERSIYCYRFLVSDACCHCAALVKIWTTSPV